MIRFERVDGLPVPDDPDESPLGYVPYFLAYADPRPAREQIAENYQHGGGWRPIKGYTVDQDARLCFPGDSPIPPIAVGVLRDEVLVIYRHALVLIAQKDETFEVGRID